MRKVVIALIASLACSATAKAETTRYICTNAQGAPDRVEINFDSGTALEFNKDKKGSITPESKSVPASITDTSIRWPDVLDGTTYAMDRATGVMKKLFEGGTLYLKKCKKLPAGSNWQ
jgi:hypothetical protein